MGPRFKYRHFEQALMLLESFPDSWRPKLAARLRQLYTLGMPRSAVRPEGGGRAAYSVEDLCQVGLVLEFVQCGLTTSRGVQLVDYFWNGWMREAFFDAYRAKSGADAVYLYLDPTDLDGFQKAGSFDDVLEAMRARAAAGARPNIPFAAYTRSELFAPGGPLNDEQDRTPVRGIVICLSHFLRRLETVMAELKLADSQQFRDGLAEFARVSEEVG